MRVLITGASRGIGKSLVEKALEQNMTVLAITRSEMALKHPQLISIQADISNPEGLKKLSSHLEVQKGIDILINNAGILIKQDLDDIKGLTFAESFHVNATTPFLITQQLLPILKKSQNPKVIQISTMMSSIQDNQSGGYYSYRSSKMALNMITKSLSVDHPDVAFGLIHPGWVKTEMGGPEAPVTTEASADGIWKVIQKLEKGQAFRLQDFRGRELPW